MSKSPFDISISVDLTEFRLVVDRLRQDLIDWSRLPDRTVIWTTGRGGKTVALNDALKTYIDQSTHAMRPAARVPNPPSIEEHYVCFNGRGAYLARQRLKAHGARWDSTHKVWYIRKGKADWAWVQIQLAERAGVELPVDEESDPDTGQTVRIEKIRCFECGQDWSVDALRRRPGADPAGWYCGCAEDPRPPRLRP